MPELSDAFIESVSGSIGSILALLATFPLKTIYTLQALNTGHQGHSAAFSLLDIIRKYKLSGLYVGIEPNIVESGISSGVYFYLYSKLRNIAVQSRIERLNKVAIAKGEHLEQNSGSSKSQDIGILASLLVAAVAAAGNQLVTLPASVVATRMQAQQKLRIESKNPKVQTDTLSVISDILREGGIGGFWSGLFPALVLVVNPAVQYMVYEQILRLMRRWKQKKEAGQNQEAPSDSQKLSPMEIFTASAIAKIIATVVTYPMVVIKSRVQAASQASEVQYKGTLHAISTTFNDEGFGGFFKGLRAKILQTALNAALMLMLKEQCYTLSRRVLTKNSSNLLCT